MPQRIPISGRDPTPEPPPYGGLGEAGWARGKTFLELVEHDEEQRDELQTAYASLRAAAEERAFFAEYPRRVRVLVLGDLTQIDTRFNVAHAEALFAAGDKIWMRVFAASENLDLVRIFVGARHDTPLFVFFGDDRHEFARWGPRPRPLETLEAQTGPPASAREREMLRRDFYVGNAGHALAEELHELLAPRLGGR